MATGSFFPKRTQDRALFLLMVFGIPFAVFFEAYYVLPRYYSSVSAGVYLHVTAVAFILLNIAGNMYYVIAIDSSTKFLKFGLPNILKPGWRYCSGCQLNSPPRAYHCKTCNECILKRDHHCLFTGTCVGHRNHRYFFVGCLYLFVGALYGNLYSIDFFVTELGGWNYRTFLLLCGPHVALLCRLVSVPVFILATLQDVAFIVLLVTSWMFAWQIYLIWRGQTMWEAKHGMRAYDNSWKENFREVLGTCWYSVWVHPWAKSPLLGDGDHFLSSDEGNGPLLESVKDI